MDRHPRDSIQSIQSVHEIGLARQLVFSPGRAEVVMVGSPSQLGTASQLAAEEVGHGVGGDDTQQQVEHGADVSLGMGSENVARQGPQRRRNGPRVLFVGDDGNNRWSTFANPDCLHDWNCGHAHKAPPRIVFMPDGVPSGERAFRSASGQTGTTTDSELTSAPAATGKKTSRAQQKEYLANRTADWIVNLPPEATSNPYLDPPPATPHNSQITDPENMGTSQRDRRQDSAIRGNFIPLSKSVKEHSTPPRREQEPRGLYQLQLSLTDSQMDCLAAVLSEDSDEPLPRGRSRNDNHEADVLARTDKQNVAPRTRSRSPAKTYQSTAASRARSRSPVKFNLTDTPESQRTIQGPRNNTASASPSRSREIRFEREVPSASGTPSRTGGRSRGPPPPIDTELAKAHARMAALRVGKATVVVHNPPERAPSPVRQPSQYPLVVDDSSSHYSQDSTGERYPSYISPLHIQKDNEPKHLSILQEYIDQKNSVRGSDKASSKADPTDAPDEASSGAEIAYTPLAPFLPRNGIAVRKASKTLIGEGGWLENTSKREQAASPTRAGGFLGNLVKKAKEMIEANQDNRAQRKSRESDKSRPASRQLAISLSPREQSLLYCELEFALTTALNDYITSQFNAGRLEADRLKKVAEDWQRKGRPKVVGFRYDMETQLDLVRMHVNDFMFYSRPASSTAILGVIDTAKANARVMRVRTFCQPDTVIAKQLLDAQGLFNVLGCPEDQQIKLAEIVAFFKAAVERQRVQALLERQGQLQQHVQHAQQHQQHHQQPVGAVGSSSVAAGVGGGVGVAASATSPVRNSRSPTRQQQQGEDWWGTAAGAAAGHAAGQHAHGAGKMDPAGYDSQGE